MKKLNTFLVLAFTVITANAQIVNIPDANFKAKLIDLGFDTNSNGQIEVSEIQNIYYLDVSFDSIADLTGIESFTNLTYLNCAYNHLTTLDVTQNSLLETLIINDNYELTTLDVTQNLALNYLDCGLNQLTTLDVTQNLALTYLDCGVNQLTTLDITQNSLLETLIINEISLSSLDVTQHTALTYLDCSYNDITTLDVTQNIALTSLKCKVNQLSILTVAQNPALTYLDCTLNQLTTLDVTQNSSLANLSCSGNQISTLDVTQNSNLETLDCSHNPLASLNVTQNSSLTDLNCAYNSLNSIDVTQNLALLQLFCEGNQLTSLDVTQNIFLEKLECWINQLTTLDVTQNSAIDFLNCGYNLITNLDISNLTVLEGFHCSNNPQLISLNIKNGTSEYIYEFSDNPNLQYICADIEQEQDIQNQIIEYGYTNCNLNSYCSFTPGGTFYTIQGTAKIDVNNNGCDITDAVFPYLKFNIANNSTTGTLISNESGTYSIPVQEGTHTITPVIENPTYFNISPTSASVTFPGATSPFTQDFCVTTIGVHNDVEVSIFSYNAARPGFDANYKIIYKNKGNQVSDGSLSFSFDDNKMDLVSAIPVNTSSATNSLTWNYTGLNPFETREINLVFNINSPMETPAVNDGDVLTYTATIVGATDEMPNDNTMTLNQTVVNSFDPNDKTCLEGNTITPSMVGNYVHYVIRFENTGTFPAENVVVSDMIDLTKFDIASLIPQNSSHSFVTRINNTTGKVEFIFENINLPFDDVNNDGYVAFKIKTKSTLVLGDTFDNTANIYFDYNFPITTNTASTTVAALSTQDFDFNSVFRLSPVPTKDELTITNNQNVTITSLNIYNTLGQLVQVITNPSETIDVSSLKTGNYVIKISSDKGTASGKFIKE